MRQSQSRPRMLHCNNPEMAAGTLPTSAIFTFPSNYPLTHVPSLQEQDRHMLEDDADCLAQFNPSTREDYESTIASWIGSLLVLAEHVSSHPQPKPASKDASQEQLPEPKARPYQQDLAL